MEKWESEIVKEMCDAIDKDQKVLDALGTHFSKYINGNYSYAYYNLYVELALDASLGISLTLSLFLMMMLLPNFKLTSN